MIAEDIRKMIEDAGVKHRVFDIEHPDDLAHGDYSSNVALVAKVDPKEIVEKLNKVKPPEIAKIEAVNGFINFYLSDKFFVESVKRVDEKFGANEHFKGGKVMVEYTDPNVMKPFHAGHLMSNVIGESISRLIEFSGAEVKRANYFSDIGLGIAKAVWGKRSKPELPWGQAYAYGVAEFDKDQDVEDETKKINVQLYDRSNQELNKIYDEGRKWSLINFDLMYKRLGSKFDYFFPESEMATAGREIVLEFLKRGVFKESEGAVIFEGEKHGLHNRVFINSQGLPTYEAKELGLTQTKYDKYKFDLSIVITANEQNEYFKVVLAAMAQIFPGLAKKTHHLSHGMLRLPSGKMSSRTGNVILAEDLIDEAKKIVKLEAVAVGAIKYSILKSAAGQDIIFDFDKSLSFEGNSGPYLQYTYARCRSVLEKASSQPLAASRPREVGTTERLLYRFPEIVERAQREYAPHYVCTYLHELAQSFNKFYEKNRILDAGDDTPYRLLLTSAVSRTLHNGLWLLGITAIERM